MSTTRGDAPVGVSIGSKSFPPPRCCECNDRGRYGGIERVRNNNSSYNGVYAWGGAGRFLAWAKYKSGRSACVGEIFHIP